MNPDAWIAHVNLGLELAIRGERDAALKHYAEALRRTDGGARAKVKTLIANVLLAKGENRRAIDLYHEALEVKTKESLDYAAAQQNLGIAYAAEGEFALAADHFQRFLEVRPDSVSARSNLGAALALAMA